MNLLRLLLPVALLVAPAPLVGAGTSQDTAVQVRGADPDLRIAVSLPPGDSIAPSSGWRPGEAPDVQEVLLELWMGRLAQRLVEGLERNGEALLPTSAFLDLAEVRFSLGEDGVLHAVRNPGNRPITVDSSRDEVRLDGRVVPTDPDALELREGELFLGVDVLEALFDITIRTDWTELTAVVMNPGHLPIGVRRAREARWNALQYRRDTAPIDPDRSLNRSRAPLGGAVLDWSVASSLRDVSRTTRFSGTLGAQVFGGSLQVSGRNLGASGTATSRAAASYHVAWPERTWIRQLRVGDGLSSGPRPRTLRGIHLSNEPIVRESFFGTGTLSGRFEPGWDVELRKRGQILDVSRTDEQGAYALDIPLQYGQNAVEVVAFGPHGEVVTAERLLVLQRDRLPRGRLEWGLSAGQCPWDRCSEAGNADVRYGLTDRVTIRGGADAFVRDTLPDLVHPYGEIAASVTSSLTLSGEVVGDGFVRGTGILSPSPHLRLRTAVTGFASGVEAPILHASGRTSMVESDVFLRPLGDRSHWLLQGSLVHMGMEDRSTVRWQALSQVSVSGLRLEGGLRGTETRMPGLPETRELRQVASVTGSRRGLPGPWTRQGITTFRAEAEVLSGTTLDRVRARITHRMSRDTRIDVSGDWSRMLGTRLSVSVTATLDALRSVTQWTASEVGPSEVLQFAQGGIQWNDATGGIRFADSPSVERAGLAGYVYLDEEGTGRMDPGDPRLAGVQVLVNGRGVVTDENGRYQVWELVPYERTRVELRPGSFTDPTLAAVDERIDLRLSPSGFQRLDLGVTRSAEVFGRVTRVDTNGGERPLPGLEVLVVSVEDEARTYESTTFSDGGFYLMAVPPGEYEVRAAPAVLGSLGLELESTPRITVTSAGALEPGGRIEVRLVPSSPTGPAGGVR